MPILTPGGNVSPCGELLVAALGLLVHGQGGRSGPAAARLAELGVSEQEAILTTSRYVGISINSDDRTWNHSDSVSPEMRGRFDDMLATHSAPLVFRCPIRFRGIIFRRAALRPWLPWPKSGF